ncbi:MAG: helix-turn-helix transcriptional regulator [Aerococcus sp.]|nr:helix-turn-helix transcriptional regulator [Aerococcus sp.]
MATKTKIPTDNKRSKELARKQASNIAADVLLKIRIEKGLSQMELARISGRKQSYISRVESKNQNVSLATLQGIVNAAGGQLKVDVQF